MSAAWLLIFEARTGPVSCTRKRNSARWCKSFVVMDAIAGGCVIELGGEGMRALCGLYIEADRAQFICHPGNLLLHRHTAWWIDTSKRKFCSLSNYKDTHKTCGWYVGA